MPNAHRDDTKGQGHSAPDADSVFPTHNPLQRISPVLLASIRDQGDFAPSADSP